MEKRKFDLDVFVMICFIISILLTIISGLFIGGYTVYRNLSDPYYRIGIGYVIHMIKTVPIYYYAFHIFTFNIIAICIEFFYIVNVDTK